MVTQELDEFVLSFHGLDLSLILGLILFDAGTSPVLGGAFEEFAIVNGVVGELSAMRLLTVVVEGSVGVVELAAEGVTTLVEIVLALLLGCVRPRVPFCSDSASSLGLNSPSSSELFFTMRGMAIWEYYYGL